jgi:2,5-diketo-D-gluconate reductase B
MDLPSVGLGTMRINDPEPILTALAAGYRHIDTAQIYDNQDVVGDALDKTKVSLDSVTIATKLWVDALAAERVESAARESADLLGVDTLDLLYVHRPRGRYDRTTTLAAFDRIVNKGLVDDVGVSNFELEELNQAVDTLETPLSAHQTELHPLYYKPELLEHARKYGYTVVGYSPLAGGRVNEIDVITDIADTHETTPEAVAIAWAVNKDPVVTIPKASSERHIYANLDAAELNLTTAQIDAIDSIEREKELYPE